MSARTAGNWSPQIDSVAGHAIKVRVWLAHSAPSLRAGPALRAAPVDGVAVGPEGARSPAAPEAEQEVTPRSDAPAPVRGCSTVRRVSGERDSGEDDT